MSIVDKTRKKFDEYGLKIYNDYSISDDEEYVFFVEDMVVFINTKDSTIGVSFQVTTIPEKVGQMILILNEIEGSTEIDVMESFTFDNNNKFLSGDKAHTLVERSKEAKIIHDFLTNQAYKNLLVKSEGYQC